MRLSNLFNMSVKNLKRNKSNIFFTFILLMLNVTIIVGLSYYNSLVEFWKSMTERSYDFNLIYLYSSDMLKSVKNNEHILDVFSFLEYREFGTFDDFLSDDIDGTVSLIGIIPNVKKIISGLDLRDDEDGMICPNNFYPDSHIYSGNYDKNKKIDLNDYIGRNIKIKYLDEFDISLKLVGIFDASYDYSLPNACFVSHSTLSKLNNEYNSKKKSKEGVFVLLDNIKNINEVFPTIDSSNYLPVTQLNTEVGNKILRATTLVSVILIIILIMFCYAVSSRRIVKESKNIGILKICGYSDGLIKKIFFLENIILAIFSFVFSFVISIFIINNLSQWLLQTDLILYNLHVNLSLVILLFGVIITCLSLFLSTRLSLKSIDSLDISEILNV